jgi:hypothetical protein
MTKKKGVLKALKIFLTFPQWRTKEQGRVDRTVLQAVLDEWLQKFGVIGSVEDAILAQEAHQDGSLHLHFYLKFRKIPVDPPVAGEKYKTPEVDFNWLDGLTGKRGNYQAVRSEKGVSKYCIKEDDYVYFGSDPRLKSEFRSAHHSMALIDLVAGKMTPMEAVIQSPQLLLTYDRLKKNVDLFMMDKKRAAEKDVRKGEDGRVSVDLILLIGESGAGKTTLAMQMCPDDDVFVLKLSRTTEPWWFDGYAGQTHLVIDNVSRGWMMPYDQLLTLVNITRPKLQVKGGMVDSMINTVIITSVTRPEVWWTNVEVDVQFWRRVTKMYEATYGYNNELVWESRDDYVKEKTAGYVPMSDDTRKTFKKFCLWKERNDSWFMDRGRWYYRHEDEDLWERDLEFGFKGVRVGSIRRKIVRGGGRIESIGYFMELEEEFQENKDNQVWLDNQFIEKYQFPLDD